MRKIDTYGVLFTDIETANLYPTLDQAPQDYQDAWVAKMKYHPVGKDLPSADSYLKFGALHPEFAGVICICWGAIQQTETGNELTVRRASVGIPLEEGGEPLTEAGVLQAYADSMTRFATAKPQFRLCAHYGIGFDFPFMAKRFLINYLEIPAKLNSYGKKPWETDHLDTKEIWKFGGYESAPLVAIAAAFGLPSPKDDIDGSQVGEVYWAGGIERITTYCSKDVITLANIFLCMQGKAPMSWDTLEQVQA